MLSRNLAKHIHPTTKNGAHSYIYIILMNYLIANDVVIFKLLLLLLNPKLYNTGMTARKCENSPFLFFFQRKELLTVKHKREQKHDLDQNLLLQGCPGPGEEPVRAFKTGRHETPYSQSWDPSCCGTLSTVTLYQSLACSRAARERHINY